MQQEIVRNCFCEKSKILNKQPSTPITKAIGHK